ncbi:heptaprenyl diphosphate synthase component 1 [Viridibacillus sp. YIM B01967]|jgi:heptaprenyl diphosphate synthase|uniref:Heptaprenyl diphosphate synthase component 1 n=1 Tax=Viridibacillus soli TaxID=2798301 RepID=A0ABS1HB87_9BACL|nr:heptaprenyl diphosphate synthase component 1 [Viridibacillus soli]MBK3496719.1 heptaprenyl diphosphate synthase component 1 [Viridibacillus soli]
MNAANIDNKIQELQTNILMQLHHRTLLKYTGQPIVENETLFYLLLPFLNGEKWTNEQDEVATTIGMIYTALHAHDQIDEVDATSKGQQLTVLAGDFYSGMYYQMLSKIPNIALIRLLSGGVVDISEKKTAVYEPTIRPIADWLHTLTVIESKSIEQFMKHYHFDQYIPLMQQALVLNRLAYELRNLQQTHMQTRIVAAIEKSEQFTSTKRSAERILEDLVSELSSTLIRSISTSPFLQDEVKTLIISRMPTHTCEQLTTREG